MRLSWNEMRSRAVAFSEEWKDARYEKGEMQSFYNDFFEIFDIRRRSVSRYEEHVKKLDKSYGFIDLFWPGVLIVEQKSAGRDLQKAKAQAGEYFDALRESQKPRYQLVCDFQNFELLDRDTGEESKFTLADLPQNIEKFGFIMGVEKRTFRDQDPVNIEAAELMGKLHDALTYSKFTGHELEVFLTRLVFCMFADDTGIFEPRDIFLDFLETRTKPDGSDTGALITQLFQVLNTHEDDREKNLDDDLNRFPHVNGALFKDSYKIPAFNKKMREHLIDAAKFNWTNISPAIFGSMFQSVMDADKRRSLGAHYTTEKNILKLIEPLFLEELQKEFATIKARKNKRATYLKAFHNKLAKLNFFDPACGCGNFLIIAYRELRLLELEVLKLLHEKDLARMKGGATELPIKSLLKLDVDQFYGIEIEEFPARIAETALWMMDHIMNTQASLELGAPFLRIPLEKSPSIACDDALKLDWKSHLLPKNCNYIMGNPPFSGQSYRSPKQREQMRILTNPTGKTGMPLDFVGAWFLKAGDYAQGQKIPFGFVCTNSLTQGQQVALLWPVLFERYGLEITFAHRTFLWDSEARGKANVHVVIVGLEPRNPARKIKQLFSYTNIKGVPEKSQHVSISPYLFDASGLSNPNLVIKRENSPLSDLPKPSIGCQVIDDGFFTFLDDEKKKFIQLEPNSAEFFKPFFNANDFINNTPRWVLYLKNTPPNIIRSMPHVVTRIKKVKAFRLNSKRKATLEAAKRPSEFALDTAPSSEFLIIPRISSEKREYIPMDYATPPVIPSDSVIYIECEKPLSILSILTSAMHMAWMRTVAGRLKSDYCYSIGVVYNTFPMPLGKDLSKLERHGQAILDARANHPNTTLADLYDPISMPADLRKAHNDNDRAVDKLYNRAGFTTERERVEHLFALYDKRIIPMLAKPKKRRR